MSKFYKVINRTNHEYKLNRDYDPHEYYAAELRNRYGLWFLTVEEIKSIWEDYSERSAAGWLIPDDKEEIERVFGVELEEVNEYER